MAHTIGTDPSHSLSRFDSSIGRGDFVTKIGVGQVIKGKWLAVLTALAAGMNLR